LSNIACAAALAENMTPELRQVWLCHLSEENNHPELARKTIESYLRQYGIIAGVDFQLDILKRNTPTGIFDLV
jgi:phosphoribosyl 1,2-cyclic phosphodiesterase